MAGAGDAGQKRAIGDGREHHAVADEKDIGGGAFGKVAEGVGHQGVAETLLLRLDQHPGVVGVKAASLGVAQGILQHRAAKAGPGQGGGAIGRRQRNFFQADGKAGAIRMRHDAEFGAIERPIHRPDVDVLPRAKTAQPVTDDRRHCGGVASRGDHQRPGRAVDPRAMQVEVRAHPVK